jgi:hypothetical protein
VLNESALVPLSQGLSNEMAASAGLMGRPNQIEAVMSKLEKRAGIFEDAVDDDPSNTKGENL